MCVHCVRCRYEDPVAHLCAVFTRQNPAVVIRKVPREDLLLGGEVLHILRPVVYALLRMRRSEESWTPVVVSFLVEASGYATLAAWPVVVWT